MIAYMRKGIFKKTLNGDSSYIAAQKQLLQSQGYIEVDTEISNFINQYSGGETNHIHQNMDALNQVSGANTGDQNSIALASLAEKSYNSLTEKPESLPPDPHGHPIGDITNLQGAIDGKETANPNIQEHVSSTSNPHSVTKSQVGLSNVDNTSDASKPVSTAMQDALDSKANTNHNQDASTINSGTLDGDRLPAMSTAKKGAVPATGTPSGKYLKDDGTFDTPAGGGGSTTPDVSYFRRIGTPAPECWYTAPNSGTALTTGAPSANILRAIPFVVPKNITLDRIAINITTLLAGKARLGIYSDSGNLYPGAKIIDAGEVDTGTTGVKSLTINQALPAGLYWLVQVKNAASIQRCFAVTSLIPILGFNNTLPTTPGLGYQVSFTYAVLPATFPSGATVITAVPIPTIFARLSA